MRKSEFSQPSVKCLGQIADQLGVRPDPDKVSAILNLQTPTCIGDIRRFLGMTNQLGKFSRHLADETKPLRDLLSSKNQWCREEPQQKAFVKVKEEISRSPEIDLFDPGQETIVSADASSYSLGAVLLQKQASGESRRGTSPSNIIKVEETRIQQLNHLHEMLPVIFTYLT